MYSTPNEAQGQAEEGEASGGESGDEQGEWESDGEGEGDDDVDSSEEEEGGEWEKGPDSEVTDRESRAPLPRRRSRVLRLSPSDDDEDDDEQDGGSLPSIRKKDRTGLISRGSVPAPRRTADAPSASKLPEIDPSSRLSGFKFGRRPLELTGDDP